MRHHVILSIVGADRAAHLRLPARQGRPGTARRGRRGAVLDRPVDPVLRVRARASPTRARSRESCTRPPRHLQPIASRDVVTRLAEVVTGPRSTAVVEVAGPEPLGIDTLVRRLFATTGDPREVVTDRHAGYFGAGSTTPARADARRRRLARRHHVRPVAGREPADRRREARRFRSRDAAPWPSAPVSRAASSECSDAHPLPGEVVAGPVPGHRADEAVAVQHEEARCRSRCTVRGSGPGRAARSRRNASAGPSGGPRDRPGHCGGPVDDEHVELRGVLALPDDDRPGPTSSVRALCASRSRPTSDMAESSGTRRSSRRPRPGCSPARRGVAATARRPAG